MSGEEGFLLRGVILLEGAQMVHDAAVAVEQGRISFAGRESEIGAAPGLPVFDGGGMYLAPGFIDLQVNGAFGHDFTSDPDSIGRVAARLPQWGVTAFLPTFVSSPLGDYRQKLQAVTAARKEARGARVLGAHLEGPFINPAKAGAHDADLLLEPGLEALKEMGPLDALRLLTLAPELPGALPVIRWLRERDVVVGLGHSQATEAQALYALEAGATWGTHLFNAMGPFHHREPGLAGALLTSPSANSGIIADGRHVAPGALRLAFFCLGPDRLALVSDAMAGAGAPPGEYALGDRRVRCADGRALLADGTLAGSLLTMARAVGNAVAQVDCTPAEAAFMASAVPARVLGLAGSLGRLRAGRMADLALLDSDLQVQAAWVGGCLLYVGEGAPARMVC